MKIQGPNATNINAYKNQLQKQVDIKKPIDRKDQLDISSEAKKLQKTEINSAKRSAYVQEIKHAVESGQYEVNSERTSEKMIHFWSKHS